MRDAFDHLMAVEVEGLDARGAEDALRCARQLNGWIDARMITLTRHLDALHATGQAQRAAVVVGRTFGKTDAGRIARRSEALESVPVFAAVLEEGAITTAHVDAVTAAVAQTPAVADHQVELADAATRMTPDEFRHLCTRSAFLLADDGGVSTFEKQRAASVVKRWVDKVSGMYMLRAELDPERGAQMWAAIDTHIDTQFHTGASAELSNDQRAAVALHALTTTGGRGAGVRAAVHVHIDLDTLRHGLNESSHVDVDGGGTLPVDAIRRLACDADIIPHVLNGHRVELDQGRAKRLATAAQRQALRAMHPTCAFPGCTVAFAHTKIHHLHAWESGGTSDLHNLVPVCDRHHHDLHEGRWTIEIAPGTRQITASPPEAPP